MMSGKYSERNFPLKASNVNDSPLSSIMDLVLVHQCSASPVSMYLVKANLFSAGHVFASKILSRSFSHWSAVSGLVFPLNFTGWCFRKSSRLHSLIGGRGFRPNTGAVALFLPTGEGSPYAAYVHPRQSHVPVVAQAMLPVAASLPHDAASSLCFAASWEPPSPLLPWRYRASQPGTITKSYEEVP